MVTYFRDGTLRAGPSICIARIASRDAQDLLPCQQRWNKRSSALDGNARSALSVLSKSISSVSTLVFRLQKSPTGRPMGRPYKYEVGVSGGGGGGVFPC